MADPRPSSTGVVVKLGGSVITDKRGDRPRIRRAALARLAVELAAAPPVRVLAVVHGAGSFGHGPVLRAGIHLGAHTPAHRLAWGEIQVLQNELNAAVCRALLAEGLPAVPFQASAAAVMAAGRLARLDRDALVELSRQGMVPVLFGVPAPDREQGCSILSGDVLVPEVAVALNARRVVYGTDVDGVFTADPRRSAAAERLERVTPATWPAVAEALGGAASADVTGGMRGKVRELLELVERGLSARIVDANHPGHLLRAIRGKPVGTLLCADPEPR